MNESQPDDSRWYPKYPMVAVHPLILKEGRLLLVKRAKEPSKGKWSIPGGRLELGETLYEAGRREVLEECSIEIEIERLLDIEDLILKDDVGRVSYHFVLVYLIATHKTGLIKANSESEDIGWFTPTETAGLDVHPQLRAVLARAGFTKR